MCMLCEIDKMLLSEIVFIIYSKARIRTANAIAEALTFIESDGRDIDAHEDVRYIYKTNIYKYI